MLLVFFDFCGFWLLLAHVALSAVCVLSAAGSCSDNETALSDYP